MNDASRPILQNISSIQFSIYDQNSTQVFTTSTIGQGWNTTLTVGSAVKYYYRIQATTNSGRKIGTCGEVYKLSCFPTSPQSSQFRFEDQLTPFGFTVVTNESLGNCP
ncbi:MAG: hypothetical protein H7Y42_01495 [Chitinophagaceae bacterium]|nr:hypothetical protein [Chitinophagaceae bacterium]